MGLFAIIIFIMGLIPTWLGKYIEFFAASYAWFALWGYIVAWILTLFSSKGKWKTDANLIRINRDNHCFFLNRNLE